MNLKANTDPRFPFSDYVGFSGTDGQCVGDGILHTICRSRTMDLGRILRFMHAKNHFSDTLLNCVIFLSGSEQRGKLQTLAGTDGQFTNPKHK
jgi:hypothetical protein